ncbi:MAG: CoA transferase [Actinomycetota bacterium]|nr:CoA transferase [Actinomycetota bacterium]
MTGPATGPDAPSGAGDAGTTAALAAELWRALGGDGELIDRLRWHGPRRLLPSVFDVGALSAASVAVANLAAAELAAVRADAGGSAEVASVEVDRRAAAAAFRSESLLEPIGWERPPIWDPVAGVYEAADGWIRLHTNYASHRVAALSVLGVDANREAVRAAVARWPAVELETAVVDAGGCAAVLRDRATWRATDAGRAGADAPLVERATAAAGRAVDLGRPGLPYAGVRVLDLTRVIAGPVCTRTLAALGADVVRIDPPGFEEVGALLADTTVGKRCAGLDLRDDADRVVFEALVADAHVVVSGLRPGALDGLGYGVAELRRINPSIVTATLDAWGWSGPWRHRRGFDSLVQMACGIAAAGAAASGADRPVPLPAQALDHATGYLLAAAVGRSLVDLVRDGVVTDTRASLLATADLLFELPVPGGLDGAGVEWDERDTVAVDTAWGPVRRCPHPGRIDGVEPRWVRPAGPVARDLARFDPAGSPTA